VLSIIIVNYRSWSFLEDCLNGLISDPLSGSWQIIVVDNHSDDGGFESFSNRFSQVEFVLNDRNGGFAFGCNTGTAIARGTRFLFLNPDVIPRPGQIRDLLEIKDREQDVAILTARQVNAKNQLQKTWDVFPDLFIYFKSVKSLLRRLMPSRYPNPRIEQHKLTYCDWVTGAVLLIDRDDFVKLGGWCEDYWLYSEDCDLCFQASRNDMRSACTPDVSFVHLHGGASRQSRGVTVKTKAETIISRHFFNHRNYRGFHRLLNHCFILLAALPELMIWSLVDLLTLRRIDVLSIRSEMLKYLLGYYSNVMRSGDWRSPQLSAQGLDPA
jgi:GT2 family glycosyltransferase